MSTVTGVRGVNGGVFDRDMLLWIAVVIVAVADVSTTWYGISQLGGSELNPAVSESIAQYGVIGMVSLKIVVIGFSITLGNRLLSDGNRWVVPVCLAVPWGIATAINAMQIALVI